MTEWVRYKMLAKAGGLRPPLPTQRALTPGWSAPMNYSTRLKGLCLVSLLLCIDGVTAGTVAYWRFETGLSTILWFHSPSERWIHPGTGIIWIPAVKTGSPDMPIAVMLRFQPCRIAEQPISSASGTLEPRPRCKPVPPISPMVPAVIFRHRP